MDLPYKPYLSISCSCGQACVEELSAEQLKIAQKDLVAGLRLLSPKDQRAAADFYAEHKKMGHDPQPALLGLAPLPKS